MNGKQKGIEDAETAVRDILAAVFQGSAGAGPSDPKSVAVRR